MRSFDLSSWQGILSSLLGLALFALIGVGIRVLLTMTIQQRRERANRQINERLKTLMSAYKVLGGSFTGDLTVVPTHLRDLRRRANPPRVGDGGLAGREGAGGLAESGNESTHSNAEEAGSDRAGLPYDNMAPTSLRPMNSVEWRGSVGKYSEKAEIDRDFFDQLLNGLPQTIIPLKFRFIVQGHAQVLNELFPIKRDIDHTRQVGVIRLLELPFDILKRITVMQNQIPLPAVDHDRYGVYVDLSAKGHLEGRIRKSYAGEKAISQVICITRIKVKKTESKY